MYIIDVHGQKAWDMSQSKVERLKIGHPIEHKQQMGRDSSRLIVLIVEVYNHMNANLYDVDVYDTKPAVTCCGP